MNFVDHPLLKQALRALGIVFVGAAMITVLQYALTPHVTPYYAMIASHRSSDLLQIQKTQENQSNDTSNNGTDTK